MIIEIKTETIKHPELGDLIKQYIYTKDDNGNVIVKEFYDPLNTEAAKLIKILQSATPAEVIQIKTLLGITTTVATK
jgi:hypothetical protein